MRSTASRGPSINLPQPAEAASVNGDGQRLATGGADGVVRLWELPTGQELQVTGGLAGGVASVAFAADGRTILATSAGKAGFVWTPAAVQAFSGQKGPILSVAVTSNGAQLLTGSADKTIQVFDLKTGKSVRTMTGHGDAVTALAITKDGAKVLSAGNDRILRVWNAADGKSMVVYPAEKAAISSLAVAADGKSAVLGLSNGAAKVLDLTGRTGEGRASTRARSLRPHHRHRPVGRRPVDPDGVGRQVTQGLASDLESAEGPDRPCATCLLIDLCPRRQDGRNRCRRRHDSDLGRRKGGPGQGD